MRFLNRNKRKVKKTVIVISDLHLGAGHHINGQRNQLEDFHSDEELCEFLKYYSSGEYASKTVELIINGDFLDFLAVPFVQYFDDEFWSEGASLDKLELMYEAHPEVFEALENFLKAKNKSIIYIVGNHDAELIHDSVKDRFLSYFDESVRSKICIDKGEKEYYPVEGVAIKHGHQYEIAHNFDPSNTIVEAPNGKKYLQPSWGSYYVINVINKYKHERYYVNQVRPIYNFLIHGLIFDTMFTLRFIFANCYYFFMVRFRHYFLKKVPWNVLWKSLRDELVLFEDFDELTKEFFEHNKEAKVLIVGHTHHPIYRAFSDGTTFINTGTWTKMTGLDFNNFQSASQLTYAKVQLFDDHEKHNDFNKKVSVDLFEWKGKTDLPYEDFY